MGVLFYTPYIIFLIQLIHLVKLVKCVSKWFTCQPIGYISRMRTLYLFANFVAEIERRIRKNELNDRISTNKQ